MERWGVWLDRVSLIYLLLPSKRRSTTQSGALLIRYALRVKDKALMRWVGPFHPAYKLEEFLLGAAAAGPDAGVPAPGLGIRLARRFEDSIRGRYHMGALGRGWSTDAEDHPRNRPKELRPWWA